MIQSLFARATDRQFPKLLYDIALDMFTIVLHWSPPSSGCNRGRDFERLFYRYCDFRQVALTERAGSRTFRGFPSNSGLRHESDAVIACPDASIHVELKFLADEVQKNDLLIFNQKGIDLLLALPRGLQQKPLYRVLLSGGGVSPEAHVFALQWGINLIYPGALPFLTIHQLAGRSLPAAFGLPIALQNEMWKAIPKFIVPLQQRLDSVAGAIKGESPLPTAQSCRAAIRTFQSQMGTRYWDALDQLDPTWIEDHFNRLATSLFIDIREAHIRDPFSSDVSA